MSKSKFEYINPKYNEDGSVKESDDLNERDALFEENDDDDSSDSENSSSGDSKVVSDQQIRVDALRISNKILKLIDRATVEDLLEISQTVSKFLKEYQPGVDVDELLGIKNSSNESNEESDDTSSDDEDSEDLTLDDLNDYEEDENDSDKDNSDDDNDEDEKDDDSTNEEGSEIPDDFLI